MLKQQGIWLSLSKAMPVGIDEAELAMQEKKAYSTILLCLADKVIIEVVDEKSKSVCLQRSVVEVGKSVYDKIFNQQVAS